MLGKHTWEFKAGLHDNVPDRPHAKVLHLLGASWRPWPLKLKLSLPQKVGCTADVVALIWDVSASGLSLHEIGGLSATNLARKSAWDFVVLDPAQIHWRERIHWVSETPTSVT